MGNNRLKIYIGITLALVVIIGMALYFVMGGSNKPNTASSPYPKSVQKVLDNPLEKIDNFSTLVSNDDYLITFGSGPEGDTFFITVNAEPFVEVSKRAEVEFITKLGIDPEYACTLPVVINIPSTLNDRLAEYNFGLSFCMDRIHVEDIEPSEPAVEEPANASSINNIR